MNSQNANNISFRTTFSHQSIRGPMLVLTNLCGMSGVMFMYLAGALLPWRHVALLCLMVPCSALVLVCVVPETPYWLLVHGRQADALRSLQWLRGWVPAHEVQAEFTEISAFVRQSNVCPPCATRNNAEPTDPIECTHASGYWRRCLEMLQPNTMRPLLIVAVCFTLTHTCGLSAVRPFLVQIVKVFGVPVDASHFSVVIGCVELAAFAFVMAVVRFTGKRQLLLCASATAAVCILALSVHAFFLFPKGASSFDAEFVQAVATEPMHNWFALVLLLVMAFAAGAACGVPWMLLSELYPIR